jgi:hypothetical protein
MDFEALKASSGGRLEFFEPAAAENIEQLRQLYPDFELHEYIELLEHSNGVGELFCEGKHRFVHNMLLFELTEAIRDAGAFGPSFLAIGAPGVDGIRYGLKPRSPQVFAYLPIDQEFVRMAAGVQEFIAKWLSNDLHFHRQP